MSGRRIYVASSWKNPHQPGVVSVLRLDHEVYDFRNPRSGYHGFHWSEIDSNWKAWDPSTFRLALDHPIAARGFSTDFYAMRWADTFVLVQPSGRSAHLEAGWAVGSGRELHILLGPGRSEPELMFNLADRIHVHIDELVLALRESSSSFERVTAAGGP